MLAACPRGGVVVKAHPVAGIMAVNRVSQRDLASAIGYAPTHVERVINKRYAACPRFRRAVALYFRLPESVLFDAEACK